MLCEICIPFDDFERLENLAVTDFTEQERHELRESGGVLGEVFLHGLDRRQALIQLHALDHVLQVILGKRPEILRQLSQAGGCSRSLLNDFRHGVASP